MFINPTADGWKNAAPDLFSEILSNSKIHEFYEDGIVKAYNRFTKQLVCMDLANLLIILQKTV